MLLDVRKAPLWLRSNGAELSPAPGTQWVCLHVNPSRELRVIKGLSRRNIPFYLPLLIKHRDYEPTNPRIKIRRKAEIIPIWKGYIFCRMDDQQSNKIARSSDVVRVLTTCYQSNLLNCLLEQRDGVGHDRENFPTVRVSPGDVFSISSGPFSGYSATVLSARTNKDVVLNIGSKGASIVVRAPAAALSSKKARESVLSMEDLLFEDDPTARGTAPPARDPDSQVFQESVAVSLHEINSAVIEYFRRHPHKMHELSPRKFEELVAKILSDMGADVQLTPKSKDGGRDIIACISLPFAKLMTIVECKKYSVDRPVGLEIVERFMYTIERKDSASFGLVVTTSNFTAGAIEVEKRYPGRIGLKDFQDIASWLSSYGTWSLSRERGIWMPDDLRT